MIHIELPHVNVLSKIDLVEQYGKLGEHISVLKNCLQLFILIITPTGGGLHILSFLIWFLWQEAT